MAFASSGSARRTWTQSADSAGGRSIVKTPLVQPYAWRAATRESHGHSKDHFAVVIVVTAGFSPDRARNPVDGPGARSALRDQLSGYGSFAESPPESVSYCPLLHEGHGG